MSSASLRGSSRQYWVAIRAMVFFTLVLGIVYPVAVTAIGQFELPAQANASVVTAHGKPVGSALIGQSFTTSKGIPLPQWFQSRPSAAGNGYDTTASGGSNLGPNNPDLIKAIGQRKSVIEGLDGVSAGQIPADAVTASASGLDPHISAEYARLQVDTVAKARGISPSAVRTLVDRFSQGPDLGYLGQSTVNVLELNIALATMDPRGNG